MIMNGDGFNDSRAIISLERALSATGAWDANDGKLIGPNHPSMTYADPTRSKMCSFWYRDSNGSTEAIKVFGQQHKDFFGPASMLNLARAIAARIPSIHQDEIERAVNTLIGALNYMSNTLPDAGLVAAIAANANALPAPAAAGAYGDLPIGLASGAGLRIINAAVRTRDAAVAGYAEDRMAAVANAVDTVRDYLIPHLRASLGPNNHVLMQVINGRVSRTPDDEFDGFINNALMPHLAPIYVSARGPARSVAPEARIDVLVPTLANVLDRIQRTLTGRLIRLADLVRDGATAALLNVNGGNVVIPATVATAATVGALPGDIRNAAAVANHADKVIFDPSQPGTAAAAVTSLAAFKATLPAESIAAALDDARFTRTTIAGAADRAVFSLAAVGGDANQTALSTAMESLAKITMVYNVKERYDNAADAREAAMSRAAILTLVAAVSKEGGAVAAAQNVNRIVAALDAAGAIQLSANTVGVIRPLNQALLNAAIDQLFASGNGAVFAKVVSDKGQRVRTADDLKNGLASIADRVAKEVTDAVAARLVAAPVAADRHPRDFRVDTVMRGNARILLRSGAVGGAWTIARPGTQQPLTDARDIAALKKLADDGQPIPGYADTAEGSTGLEMPAVVARGNKLPKVSLGLVGQPGGLPAAPVALAPMQVDAGASAQPVAGSRSRYASRAPAAVAAPMPVVQQATYADAMSDAGYDFVTQEFVDNWQMINATIGNRMLAAFARCYLGTPTDWNNVRAMLAGHVPVPFSVILARPFIVMHSYAMYLLKSGTSTMMTVFGRTCLRSGFRRTAHTAQRPTPPGVTTSRTRCTS